MRLLVSLACLALSGGFAACDAGGGAPDEDSPLLYESDCGQGDAPVWFFLLGHHYGGPGGYYPEPSGYLAVLEALEEEGVADRAHFFFDGIAVDLLQREDPEGRVRSRLEAAGVPLGYHGEEIHGPGPTILDMALGLSWEEIEAATTERFTAQVDYALAPGTRKVDPEVGGEPIPGTVGGLALVREYFGRDLDVMPNHGLPSPPAGLALRAIHDFAFYQGASFFADHWYLDAGLGREAASAAMEYFGRDTYLLWHMGRITFKNPEETYWMSSRGPEETLELLKTALPRCRPTYTKVHITEQTAPMRERIAAVKRWIAEHPGSDWLDRRLLSRVALPATGTLDADSLESGARYLVLEWDGGPPDGMLVADGTWWSLADAAEALAGALAAWHGSGALPAEVEVTGVLGPRGEPEELVLHPDPELPAVLAVRDVAAAAAPWLEGVRAADPPFLPLVVDVGGERINAAEWLLAMAEAYVRLRDGHPEGEVRVSSERVYPEIGAAMQEVYAASGRAEETPTFYAQLQMWTVKPVRLDW